MPAGVEFESISNSSVDILKLIDQAIVLNREGHSPCCVCVLHLMKT